MRVLVSGGSGFIGTNFVAFLLARGDQVLNIDAAAPLETAHISHWRKVDICDRAGVAAAVCDFAPGHIVHLAALATFEATKEQLHAANVEGTESVLDAALAHAPFARILVTSTQYVNGPGAPYDDDRKFHTVNDYGQSKANAELATRQDKYSALDWIITRPTNIWGPFHPRFPVEMWKYIRRGFYMHPGHAPIERAYGYVGNVVRQMLILLEAPDARVHHRVFYLTDPNIDSYELLNQFAIKLRGRPLARVPYPLLKALALAGDAIKAAGLTTPFRSDRLHRMTTGHTARFESLWAELGYQPASLPQAVDETVGWLRDRYPDLYR